MGRKGKNTNAFDCKCVGINSILTNQSPPLKASQWRKKTVHGAGDGHKKSCKEDLDQQEKYYIYFVYCLSAAAPIASFLIPFWEMSSTIPSSMDPFHCVISLHGPRQDVKAQKKLKWVQWSIGIWHTRKSKLPFCNLKLFANIDSQLDIVCSPNSASVSYH